MFIIPAIDLRHGRCVRLFQGRRGSETVYGHDPAAVARRWVEEGAHYLHIVDLDGAFEGTLKNREAVVAIRKAADIPLELGGGIRDRETMERVLSLGIDRVIVGTTAVRNPELVGVAVKQFGPERIVVGIDAQEDWVAVKGWEEGTDIDPITLALEMRMLGVRRVIYTDITRDGTMVGPNVEATQRLARETGLRIIASGGIASLEDVKRVAALERDGVEGMIIGKALYEGIFTLRETQEAIVC
jgi:phosphoribosylformimino-5-aminoimidazole carboxamide ribotide isomerase